MRPEPNSRMSKSPVPQKSPVTHSPADAPGPRSPIAAPGVLSTRRVTTAVSPSGTAISSSASTIRGGLDENAEIIAVGVVEAVAEAHATTLPDGLQLGCGALRARFRHGLTARHLL